MPLKSVVEELYFRISESKFYNAMTDFDKHITRNLLLERIETRPASSNGLWCCVLLPTILLLYSILYSVSPLYRIITCISIGYLFYCILFMTFLTVSCSILKEDIYGGYCAASGVSTLLLYTILNEGFIFSALISTSALSVFAVLLRLTLKNCPKTFTIGEAMVVLQGVMLAIVATVTRIFYWSTADRTDQELEFVYKINMTVISSVGIIVTALFIMEAENRTVQRLWYITSVVGVYALIVLHLFVGVDCIMKIAHYFILDMRKIQLFMAWGCLSVLAVLAVMLRVQLAVKATTVNRKAFHILASGVFMSGILIDVHFMTLAAGCGLALIVLLETLRKCNIERVTPFLDNAFKVYSDEKDVGKFAMTPIYLYVGLACPLVLVPKHRGYELELLSGVLSLGIGDTAASWFGSKYGYNRWTGGNKTYEGTIANILSQVATVYILDVFGLLLVDNALLKIIVSSMITGFVEAKTEQVDNLILPLFSIISFQIANVIGMLISL